MTNPRRTILAAVLLASLCRASLAADAPRANSAASLKAAVGHLISTFGDRYPKGRQFLGSIDRLKPGDAQALTELQRRALIANPLVRAVIIPPAPKAKPIIRLETIDLPRGANSCAIATPRGMVARTKNPARKTPR